MWIFGNCAPASHWINKPDVSERSVLLLYSSLDEHEKALGLWGAQTEIECIWAYTFPSQRTLFQINRDVSHNYMLFRGASFVCAQREAELSGTIYCCWLGESWIYAESLESKCRCSHTLINPFFCSQVLCYVRDDNCLYVWQSIHHAHPAFLKTRPLFWLEAFNVNCNLSLRCLPSDTKTCPGRIKMQNATLLISVETLS